MKLRKKLLIPILSLGLLFTVNSETSYASAIDKMTDEDWKYINYPEYFNSSQYDDESWYVKGNEKETKGKWIKYVKTQPEIARWNTHDEDGKPYDLSNSIYVENMGKKIRILKKDQNDKNISGVTFTAYATKEEAEKGKNPIASETTNEGGIAEFGPYHLRKLFIKETAVSEDSGYELDDKFANDNIMEFFLYDELYFLGEMKVTELNDNIKGGTDKNNLTTKETKNLNTYLQGLVTVGSPFNSDTNWLVYNDNGVEKLVSKKPIKYGTAWNSLYNAGVVFGEDGVKDLINADFTNSKYSNSPSLNDKGKGKRTPKTYKPQYVNMNGKTYIVRLMRAYSDDVPINNRKSNFGRYDKTKGSEWNRLILPLINPTGDDSNTGYNYGTNGRYGSSSKNGVETNMPILASYSWWKDFGGNSNSSGSYRKGSDYGVWRWTQEVGYEGYRAFRGIDRADSGAAHSGYIYPDLGSDRGWLAVLERVS